MGTRVAQLPMQLFLLRQKREFDPHKLPQGKLQVTNLGDPDKPKGAFWTSSLKGNSSAWLDWCQDEGMIRWIGHQALLFEVKPSAKVLTITRQNYPELLEQYPAVYHDEPVLYWFDLSFDYDGVRVVDKAIPGWDVESTAWLNMDALEFKRVVEVENKCSIRLGASGTHAKSIALMKFLSGVSNRLGVGKHVYVVGGAVRNFVIDKPIKDIDVVIDSVALKGKDSEWFAKEVAKAIPVANNLTTNNYGVAILSVTGPWVMDGVDLQGEVIEIANARKESYGAAGYKPTDVVPATIQEDVIRREFTFNCMTGDTLIPTEKGILRIDQIASRKDGDQQSIAITVAGQDGPAVAVGWQYSGFAPTLRVTTEWGHSFSCTHHHPVLVLRGHDHEWVQVDHLEEGDLLCVPVRQVVRSLPLVLELADPVQPKRGALKDACKPEVMTPELAFVVGCVVAEGYNTHKRVSFSNSDPALIARYAECFQATFGFQPSRNKVVEKGSVRVLRGVEFVANADGYDIYADSKAVVGWLGELGLYCGGGKDGKPASHHKVIPWSILQADERSQWAFLAAYLEGDGSIRPDTGRITFCSASPHIRQQLQVLLGAHGILSKVEDRFVYINAVDSALLWEKIQPWMVTKGYDYTQRGNKARNRYGIPADYIRGVLAGMEASSLSCPAVGGWNNKDRRTLAGMRETTRKVQRLLHDAYARGDFGGFLESLKFFNPEEHAKLKQLFDLSYQYVEVTSVEDAGEQDVFDISMGEGVEPAFVANGVVVHNTLLWRMLDLAEGPDKAEIIDLTGCGLKDLREGVARCPADPDKTFSDDPSRMVRAIKFLTKYGLKPSPDTVAAIHRNLQKLKQIPADALSNILINTFLRDSTGPQALRELDKLGLLDVIKEIAQENKGFREALAGWADREAKVEFLFVLMDMGLPAGKKLAFLNPAQQQRVREVTVGLSHNAADAYVAVLNQPGKVLDSTALIKEFGLKGPEIRKVTDIARQVLLDEPSLSSSPTGLTKAVRMQFKGGRQAAVGQRQAGSYYDWKPGMSLKEVIRLWQEEGAKATDDSLGYYSPRDLVPYREYAWTREKARNSPEEWDALVEQMRKGWNPRNPLSFEIGRSGGAKVGEGNHRLAIALKLGLDRVPVRFYFKWDRVAFVEGEYIPSWFPAEGDVVTGIQTAGDDDEGWAYLSFDSGQEVGLPIDGRRSQGWKAASEDITKATKSFKAKPWQQVVVPGEGKLSTEPFDSDDAFPPMVASWAVIDGWVVYKGRDGSIGIVVGKKADLVKWAKQVAQQIQQFSLDDEKLVPWTPEMGGARKVNDAVRVARGVAKAFGINPEIVVYASKRGGARGNAGGNTITLMNVHRSEGMVTFLESVNVPEHLSIAAHEAAHLGFQHGGRKVMQTIQDFKKSGGANLTMYHALSGSDLEGTVEAAALYVFAAKKFQALAPTVYAAVAEWFGGNRVRLASAPVIEPHPEWGEAGFGSGTYYLGNVLADEFIHFTTLKRAVRIVKSGKLLMRPPYEKFGANVVNAISTQWGWLVPGTQFTHIQKQLPPGEGMVAVLFKTATTPDYGHVEEVTWTRDVVLHDPKLIVADRAKAILANTPLRLADDQDKVVYQVPAGKTKEAASPFSNLSPTLVASLNSFASALAWWMGLPTPGNMASVSRTWRASKELREWLSQYVNLPSYTLYYGRRLESGDALPEQGSILPRAGNVVLQWSTDQEIARWFAGLKTGNAAWAGGALVQAQAARNQVVVDVDRFSKVCGQHHAEFAALMTRTDPIQMFSGESYEGEVLTISKVQGTVIEAAWFKSSVSRVARRWMQRQAVSPPSVEDLKRRYSELLLTVSIAESEIHSMGKMSLGTTADMKVDMAAVLRAGNLWGEYVIDKLAIPAGKAKAVEMAVRAFNAKRVMVSPKWFRENQKRIQLLIEAGKWPERSEESGIFKLGPFTVHDTIQANEKVMAAAKDMITKAVRALPDTGLPGMAAMAYGDLYLVGQLGRANWAAWFMPAKDSIYLRPVLKGVPAVEGARHLVHELGHRFWAKKLDSATKTAWAGHHYQMSNAKGTLRAPEVGEVLPMIVNNKKVRVESTDGAFFMLADIATGNPVGKVDRMTIAQWLSGAEVKMKFPTLYAATEAEEHFCESLSLRAMGALTGSNLEVFDRIVLGIDHGAVQRVASRHILKLAEEARYKDKKEVPKADGKGTTTVYEYSEKQVANRQREKAERIEKLRGNLHKLQDRVKKDLKSKDDHTRLCALAVGLMNDTYERVGNDESAKDGHVGVTGWTPKHVKFSDGKATFTYVGKSGVDHKKETKDADLIRVLKEAVKDKSKDDTLFSYEDGRVDAAAVNEYLDGLDLGITAKDIRGLHANREMQERLKAIRSKGGKLPTEKKEREKLLKAEFKEALEGTAEAVGHEAATLRSQYLVPGLEDEFMKDGTVTEKLDKKGSAKTAIIHINNATDGDEDEPELRGFAGLISSLTLYEQAIVEDMDSHEEASIERVGEAYMLRGHRLDTMAVEELVGAGYLEKSDSKVNLSGKFEAKKRIYTAAYDIQRHCPLCQCILHDGPRYHEHCNDCGYDVAFQRGEERLPGSDQWTPIPENDPRLIQYKDQQAQQLAAWNRMVAPWEAQQAALAKQASAPNSLLNELGHRELGHSTAQAGRTKLGSTLTQIELLYRQAAIRQGSIRALQATKSQGERDDEEAERLVRPAPPKKPPRKDLRRERMDLGDKDTETQGADKDRDLSLNYKKVAEIDLVADRFMQAALDRFGKKPKKDRLKYQQKQQKKLQTKAPGVPGPPKATTTGHPSKEEHKPGSHWPSEDKETWSGKNTKGETQSGFKTEDAAKAYASGKESEPAINLNETADAIRNISKSQFKELAKAMVDLGIGLPETEDLAEVGYAHRDQVAEAFLNFADEEPDNPDVSKFQSVLKGILTKKEAPKAEPKAPEPKAPEPEAPEPEAPKEAPAEPAKAPEEKPETPAETEAPEAPKAEKPPVSKRDEMIDEARKEDAASKAVDKHIEEALGVAEGVIPKHKEKLKSLLDGLDDDEKAAFSEAYAAAADELSKTIEGLTDGFPASMIKEAGADFTNPLRGFVKKPSVPELAPDADEKAKKKHEEQKAKAASWVKDLGARMARQAFIQEVVLDPSFIGGKELKGVAQDDEAMAARSLEAFEQTKRLPPEAREHMAVRAVKQLADLDPESPEAAELNRIVDGLHVAAVMNGQALDAKDSQLNLLREPLPEDMAPIVKKMAEQGDVGPFLSGVQDFYGPKGRKAISSAYENMNSAELVEASKGKPWEKLAEVVDDPSIDPETREFVRAFMIDMAVDDATVFQGLVAAKTRKGMSDGTTGTEFQKRAAETKADVDKDIAKEKSKWMECLTATDMTPEQKSECLDKMEGGGGKTTSAPTEGEKPVDLLTQLRNRVRAMRTKSRWKYIQKKGWDKDLDPADPSVARMKHVAETGDTSVLDEHLEVQKPQADSKR